MPSKEVFDRALQRLRSTGFEPPVIYDIAGTEASYTNDAAPKSGELRREVYGFLRHAFRVAHESLREPDRGQAIDRILARYACSYGDDLTGRAYDDFMDEVDKSQAAPPAAGG